MKFPFWVESGGSRCGVKMSDIRFGLLEANVGVVRSRSERREGEPANERESAGRVVTYPELRIASTILHPILSVTIDRTVAFGTCSSASSQNKVNERRCENSPVSTHQFVTLATAVSKSVLMHAPGASLSHSYSLRASSFCFYFFYFFFFLCSIHSTSSRNMTNAPRQPTNHFPPLTGQLLHSAVYFCARDETPF